MNGPLVSLNTYQVQDGLRMITKYFDKNPLDRPSDTDSLQIFRYISKQIGSLDPFGQISRNLRLAIHEAYLFSNKVFFQS